MNIKKSYLILILFCILFKTEAQQKPNIVLIISDDHAYQAISAYGSKLMQTPGIDRIANEGVLFEKAYVTNSICGPSRATIITGKYSNKNGFKDNLNPRFEGSQNTFIKELQKGGYLTAWIGKWHLGTMPKGFDYWKILPGQGEYYNPDFLDMDSNKVRIEGYVSNVIEDLVEDWMDHRDTSKPFCLVIGHKATHRVWVPDTSDMGMFDNITYPLPHNFFDDYAGRKAAQLQEMSIAKDMIMGYDLKMFDHDSDEMKEGYIRRMNPAQKIKFDSYYHQVYEDFKSKNLSGKSLAEWKYQRYMKDYLSTAASLDRNIGRTLDYLDKHNLTQNTIVIYMSDQGFYLGEHGWFDKRWMYEESFRTPLVMRYPGHIIPGTKNHDFVMNVDIAPTLLQAAGIPIPKDIQGTSFLPLVTTLDVKGRDAMYYHYYENGEHHVSPHFGVRNERYKLIRFYKRVNDWEFYDLQKDPNEMHNLFGQKKYRKTESKMYALLLQLIDKYDDDDARQILKNKLPGEPRRFRK